MVDYLSHPDSIYSVETGQVWKKVKRLLMESNFRTAWNLVDPTCTPLFPKGVPQILPDLQPSPGLQRSRAGWDSPSPDTQLDIHPLGKTSPPLEKSAAGSNAHSLFKVPEWNWSKSQLGGPCGHLQSSRLPSMMEM